MRRLAFAGKLVALAATFLALAATSIRPSCPPESGLLDTPLAFTAETDCGPVGRVTLHVNPHDCSAWLEGGAAAGLADRGKVYWPGSITLSTTDPLGLPVPDGHELLTWCYLKPTDAWSVECQTGAQVAGSYKTGWVVRRCRGVLRPHPVPAAPPSPPAGPPTG